MREILFRGKTSKGKWIEGYFCPCSFGRFPCKPAIVGKDKMDSGCWEADMVDPETVGQYTGELDKNGKKIFEGDIVEFYFFDKGHKNTKTMYIEWRDSGFCMRELFRDYRLADNFSIIEEKIFTYRGDIRNGVYTTNYTYFVEVIGNIFDNPELMKGADDGT